MHILKYETIANNRRKEEIIIAKEGSRGLKVKSVKLLASIVVGFDIIFLNN